MMSFFVGFAFFELDVFCGFFAASLMQAARTGEIVITVMKTHIINYAKTRSIYEAYRKAGYSKRFLEANRESIALHKAAKAAFDEARLKKLPKVKELSIEYVELLKKKKAEYPSYRKARERMQELMKAQKNVEMFFADNRSEQERTGTAADPIKRKSPRIRSQSVLGKNPRWLF